MRTTWLGLSRSSAANLLVSAVGLVVGFAVLKVGVAAEGVQGARAGAVTEAPRKFEWFLTEVLPRPLDPWSSTPRDPVAVATLGLLLLGMDTAGGEAPWRRAIRVVLALSLIVLSYVPKLLVARTGPARTRSWPSRPWSPCW